MSVFGDLLNAGISSDGFNISIPNGNISANNIASVRGKTFYVDSNNGSDNYSGKTPKEALATIDAAINKCTASQGDKVVVLPGHTETISSATGLVCDVAGVTILGIGTGTVRPTITLDTATTTTIPVSAANVTFNNIVFTANFADIAEVFTPSATDFRCENCYFKATATAMNFLSIVDTGTTDNQCDGLTFVNCSWIEPDTATLYFLDIDADLDSLVVKDCYFNLGVNTNDLPIIANVATGKDLTNVNISNNKCIRLNDANPLLVVADTTTANTGVIYDNYVRHADTATELLVTAATNIGLFNNLCTAAADASGYVLPAIDS